MNKTYKILFSSLIIIFIVVVCLFLSDTKTKNYKKVKVIKHEVADKLYKEVKKEEVSGKKKYISKLYGYTSDKEGNVTLYTKEGYVENNILYDLNNKVIGKYEEAKQNKALEKATLKTYKFNKDEKDYKLKVKWKVFLKLTMMRLSLYQK